MDIAPGETDGLPAEHSIKRFQRQAAKLIALHRAKNAFNSAAAAHRRQESAPEPSTSGGIDPNALRQALSQAGQTTTEVEEGIRPSNGLDASQPYSGTVGVLGSLLQLYTEQNKSSAAASEATLVNPPDTSLDDSRDTSPTAATFSFRRAAEGVSEAVRRPLSRFSEDNRNSRSSAGVIGTLQSSSFGLAGIASPAGSAVRPDNEKSGYRLRFAACLRCATLIKLKKILTQSV